MIVAFYTGNNSITASQKYQLIDRVLSKMHALEVDNARPNRRARPSHQTL